MLACSKWCTAVVQLLLLATLIEASTTATSIAHPPDSRNAVQRSSTTSATIATTAITNSPSLSAASVVNSSTTYQSTSQDTWGQDEAAAATAAATTIAGNQGVIIVDVSAVLYLPSESTRGSKPAPTSSRSSSIQAPEVPPKMPEDPPTKFLSFEEWKEQNLAKVGQSTDSFVERGVREPRKAPGMGNAALDALGDEIEIAFEFGSPGSPAKTIQVSGTAATGTAASGAAIPRSKNAGKTCKERFNYASFDCAATVHKHNKEGKGGNSILLENKETYMLNKCEAKDKFFIVELCEDILVDTVVLANFEFFSSVFKEIKVSVSDRYPIKASGWKELGTYVAKNARDVQAFLVENPLIWARYMKVEILSHYGNEYYCPISLLRVHGTTMMEEFRHEAAQARGGFEEDTREDVVPEAVAEPVKSAEAAEAAGAAEEEEAERIAAKGGHEKTEDAPMRNLEDVASEIIDVDVTTSPSSSSPVATSFQPQQSLNKRYRFPVEHPSCPTISPTKALASSLLLQAPKLEGTMSSETPASSKSAIVPVSSLAVVSHVPASASPPTEIPEAGTKNHSATKPVESKIQEASKASSPHPPAASPTTQESFFKSVHKRLGHLESNSTLSLQYIEEQSRLMRDTFENMEKSHISKMEQLLEVINTSAFTDLQAYKDQYNQLWQSTLLALEMQRSHSEREMLAISTRLSLLADEVIFQKRMYQLNTVLLVITIGVVLFSRNDRLAMPLGRHLRTHSSMRLFDSPPTSPQPGNLAPGLHKRSNSNESANSFGSPVSPISPPKSRESSPIIDPKSASPLITPKSRGERRSWIHFGPKLSVENRVRRWQRLPSPLAGVENDGEPGVVVYDTYFGDVKSEDGRDVEGEGKGVNGAA